MKRVNFVLLGLLFIVNVNAAWDYETKSNTTGDFEQTGSWIDGHAPSTDGIIDRRMTINGMITRNGNLDAAHVIVEGTFIVTGDYLNNRWDGLEVNNGAKVEIFGNLTGSAGISVKNGGLLIVHGNLTSTGSSFKANGDVIVKGDFSTSSSTHIQNQGNLIVGGDFSHLGGGLQAKSDDIYILNPDAIIVSPGWGIINDGDFGDIDDFLINEDGSDLADIVEVAGLLNSAIQWLGTENSDWFTAENWRTGKVPNNQSSVTIKESSNVPVISGNAFCKRLLIENNAEVVLTPGSSLDISDEFVNNGLVVLRSTPDAVSSLNVPENNTDSGNGRIELSDVKANQWYRLGLPVNNSNGEMLDATESTSWVYRSTKRWERITSDSDSLSAMEGVMVLYENDHVIDFEGQLNTGEIQRTLSHGKGYYLFSNPYPSSIKWNISDEENAGVQISDNVSSTIYYRVYAGSQVGDYMITYNGFSGISTLMEGDKLPGGYTDQNIGQISPLQSVWVKVNDIPSATDATITLNNKARVADNSMPLKSAVSSSPEKNILRVVQTNEFVSDVSVIYFDGKSSEGLDRSDSEKMFNSSKKVSEVYTLVEGKSLSINGMPALIEDSLSISFSVRNIDESEVNLSLELDEFSDDYNVLIEDKVAGTLTDLRVAPAYSYTPEKSGDNHERFVLHLVKVQRVTTNIEEPGQKKNNKIEVISSKNEVLVKISPELINNNDAIIEVIDLNGRVVSNESTRSTETRISLPSVSAVYVVKVSAGNAQEVIKVANR